MTNDDTAPPNPGEQVCPGCGETFRCGFAAGEGRCWCFDLPHALPASEGAACLCPRCLREAIRAARPDTDG